jgi:hypothetical protein
MPMAKDMKYWLPILISLIATPVIAVAQEPVGIERVELEQIDPRVDQQVDLAADLALKMQQSDDSLQPASDVRQIYSVRGMKRPMFARRSGGLTAVFPRAWIQRGEKGQFYTPIPDGTTFYIGPIHPQLTGEGLQQGLRPEVPEAQRPLEGRIRQRIYPQPLQSRIKLQDAEEILDLRVSRWSPYISVSRSTIKNAQARRLQQLIFQASRMRRFKQLEADDRRRQKTQDNENALQVIPFDDSLDVSQEPNRGIDR